METDYEHQSELTVAPWVLDMISLKGRIVTGDALYCQRGFCEQVIAEGGDYLVTVKANQPTLYEDIALVFDEPPVGELFGYAQEHNQHGDRIEQRLLWTTTALSDYLDWPGFKQVCKLERQVLRKNELSTEARYFITSVSMRPKALLELARGHWGIENRLHYVRDVTMGEDGSQVRTGSAPEVMAALRNVVLNLLRLEGVGNVAAAIRHFSWNVQDALTLIGLKPP